MIITDSTKERLQSFAQRLCDTVQVGIIAIDCIRDILKECNPKANEGLAPYYDLYSNNTSLMSASGGIIPLILNRVRESQLAQYHSKGLVDTLGRVGNWSDTISEQALNGDETRAQAMRRVIVALVDCFDKHWLQIPAENQIIVTEQIALLKEVIEKDIPQLQTEASRILEIISINDKVLR